jgi:hypothetical protein
MRRHLALCLPLLLLTGCGQPVAPFRSPAARDVARRAENAGYAMAKAGRTSSAVDHARRVVGDVGVASIELLEADGDGIQGHVVLRISATPETSGFEQASHDQACFRYDFGDRTGGTRPHRQRCPRGAALVIPAPEPVPTFPPDSEQRLTSALRAPDPQAAAARAFEGLTVGSVTVDGSIGIAVSASGGACLFGRRLADGRVEVWPVPRVLAQPGELGCGAEFAARGEGTRPPH